VEPVNHLKQIRDLLKEAASLEPEVAKFSTQRGFAKLVGCSLGLIRAVEQNETPISPRLASKISRRLGISANWLLDPLTTSPPLLVGDVEADAISLIDRVSMNPSLQEALAQIPEELQAKALQALDSTRQAVIFDVIHGDTTLLNQLLELLGDRLHRLAREPDRSNKGNR
jgi:transcriptional regulator with XRE-family HTH domain